MTGLYLGSSQVKKVYVGSTEAKAVYLGSTKIWSGFTAPLAPTPISPSGTVPNGTDTYEATYNSSDGQPCNAYALRVWPGEGGEGTYYWWNATTSARQNTEVWNTLASPVADGGTITVVAATLVNIAESFYWSMATQESGADLKGVYSQDTEFWVEEF